MGSVDRRTMMGKRLVAAVVAAVGLCKAEVQFESRECVASRKLIQRSGTRRQDHGVEEHDPQLLRAAKAAVEHQTGRERELLLENQNAQQRYEATVTELPDDFFVSYQGLWNGNGDCAGYKKNFHSDLCSRGCKLGEEIENEITKELCSNGKLKVSSIKPAGYIENTTCGQNSYVTLECAATKAKMVTINAAMNGKNYLKKMSFTTSEPMNCGKHAADGRMGLNGDIQGWYRVDGYTGSKEESVSLSVKMHGETIFVETNEHKKINYKNAYVISGWEKDVKLACLPYGQRKGTSKFWTRYWMDDRCKKYRANKSSSYTNYRDNCIAEECKLSGLTWNQNHWKCDGYDCSGRCD